MMEVKTRARYETAFFCCYLALTMLSFNSFFYYLPALRVLTALTALGGVALLALRLANFRSYQKAFCLLPAAAFLLSALFSLLLNARYGVMESAQGLLWLSFQLLLLLPRDRAEPPESVKKQLFTVGGFFIAYNAVVCLAGLIMAAMGYGELYRAGASQVIPRGFVWGRLWGAYSDPNYGAASACLALTLCLVLMPMGRMRWRRALLFISMLLFFLYVVFSDSRTGMVTLGALFGVYAFCRAFSRMGERKKEALRLGKRAALSFLCALAAALVAAGGVRAVKAAYNAAVSYFASPTQPGEKEIERGYDDASDVSNGRLALWESGFELFTKAPVFGVGFRNLVEAAKELAPDTYLVRNPQNFLYDAYHNVLVDVLASQGLVGLAALAALALCALSRAAPLFRHALGRDTAVSRLMAALLGALAAVLTESLFISDLFYVNTPTSVLFWFLLGVLLRLSPGREGGADTRLKLFEDALSASRSKAP